jgi:hypothetical protein
MGDFDDTERMLASLSQEMSGGSGVGPKKLPRGGGRNQQPADDMDAILSDLSNNMNSLATQASSQRPKKEDLGALERQLQRDHGPLEYSITTADIEAAKQPPAKADWSSVNSLVAAVGSATNDDDVDIQVISSALKTFAKTSSKPTATPLSAAEAKKKDWDKFENILSAFKNDPTETAAIVPSGISSTTTTAAAAATIPSPKLTSAPLKPTTTTPSASTKVSTTVSSNDFSLMDEGRRMIDAVKNLADELLPTPKSADLECLVRGRPAKATKTLQVMIDQSLESIDGVKFVSTVSLVRECM